jgi:hypothetical protein
LRPEKVERFTDNEEKYKTEEIQRPLLEVFDNIKELWSRLEKEIYREGKELAHESKLKIKEYVLNKKANFSVKDCEGKVLLQRGEKITEDIIEAAEADNKIHTLFLAAISQEVEDGLNTLSDKMRDIFR